MLPCLSVYLSPHLWCLILPTFSAPRPSSCVPAVSWVLCAPCLINHAGCRQPLSTGPFPRVSYSSARPMWGQWGGFLRSWIWLPAMGRALSGLTVCGALRVGPSASLAERGPTGGACYRDHPVRRRELRDEGWMPAQSSAETHRDRGQVLRGCEGRPEVKESRGSSWELGRTLKFP